MSTTTDMPAPREAAPILCLFGDAATTMAKAIHAAPDLGQRLTLAPRRALHATAAYLASEAARGLEAGALAAELSARHPRELLAAALPGCDPRLYRTLDRAPLPAWSLGEYGMLDALLRARVGAILSRSEPLTRQRVSSWHQSFGDDRELAPWLAPFDDAEDRAAMRVVLEWLREAGLLTESAPTGDAEPLAVARAAVRMLGRGEGPPAPFALPPGWQQLRRPQEVFATGRRLGNCLRATEPTSIGPALDLLTGSVVFLYHAGESVVATLDAEPGGQWSVSAILGRRNAAAPAWLKDALLSFLRAEGLTVLGVGLATALRNALRPLYMTDMTSLEVIDLCSPEDEPSVLEDAWS